MSLSFAYDSRIIVIELAGNYAIAELRDIVVRAFEDPACPTDPVMVFDLRQSLAILSRPVAEVQEMARFLASTCPNLRLAMVVSADVAFGLMRIGSVFAAQGGLFPGVFREMAAARAWLLDPNAAPHIATAQS